MRQLIALFFIMALAAARAAAQQPVDEAEARNLFRTAAASQPGVMLKLELQRKGRQSFVPLDTVFYTGDKIRLHFTANFAAYVEIYNWGTDGRIEKLFPYAGLPARVKISSAYVVPRPGDGWFKFDQRPGQEKLLFVFSQSEARPSQPSKPAPAKPAPAKPAKPKPASPATGSGVEVNPGEPPASFEGKELAIDEAVAEGKNLKRVQTKKENYLFSTAERVRRRAGILVTLEHR